MLCIPSHEFYSLFIAILLSGKICNYLNSCKNISVDDLIPYHFFLDTCHMIVFYSIIWMYSWRIHLVLFIVHPTPHKELKFLATAKNIYQSYSISVALLVIPVNCRRPVNVHVIMSVYELTTQNSFFRHVYPGGSLKIFFYILDYGGEEERKTEFQSMSFTLFYFFNYNIL